MKEINIIIICLLCILTIAYNKADTRSYVDDYNISWDTQSKNSSESMPLVGGDIGCNMWVENGDILFYMSRSGSLSENGTYFNLSRVRIQLSPNPFANPTSFRHGRKIGMWILNFMHLIIRPLRPY